MFKSLVSVGSIRPSAVKVFYMKARSHGTLQAQLGFLNTTNLTVSNVQFYCNRTFKKVIVESDCGISGASQPLERNTGEKQKDPGRLIEEKRVGMDDGSRAGGRGGWAAVSDVCLVCVPRWECVLVFTGSVGKGTYSSDPRNKRKEESWKIHTDGK